MHFSLISAIFLAIGYAIAGTTYNNGLWTPSTTSEWVATTTSEWIASTTTTQWQQTTTSECECESTTEEWTTSTTSQWQSWTTYTSCVTYDTTTITLTSTIPCPPVTEQITQTVYTSTTDCNECEWSSTQTPTLQPISTMTYSPQPGTTVVVVVMPSGTATQAAEVTSTVNADGTGTVEVYSAAVVCWGELHGKKMVIGVVAAVAMLVVNLL